jgi:chitin disaccharide deacetylase
VEIAHRAGILSAASLMVAGPAAADAVDRARRLPSLRVGLHLTLVDADPIRSTCDIPRLVDKRGRLRSDLWRLGLDIAVRPATRRQLAAEIVAQFEAYRATGLALDHVNAHKHFHLHPIVAAMLMDIGKRYGIGAIRVPYEPISLLDSIEPRTIRGQAIDSRALQPWSTLMRTLAQRQGLAVPDAMFGIAWSGALTKARLLGLLTRLPAGIVEIYTHPATSDTFPGHAAGYRYVEELAALTDPDCVEALELARHPIGGYSDLTHVPAESGDQFRTSNLARHYLR